ncbi:DUF4249 domain-containing protein [Flavobacterium rhizosphaerae]|uniref:DUF4249 domain-containing protein n=1 Tax=Flavobacterium rhizosphaerae TaxID=3163298 RepID=A0ABW8YUB7_9FLAO
MKKIYILFAVLTALILTSCEEVIDVDLDTAKPRLVVDASINWYKNTDGSQQVIKLTTTNGFYESEVPKVNGATVFVTNSQGTLFTFTENPGTGEYTCNYFAPVINETYTLTVEYNDQMYTATETLYAVPEIGNVVQDNEGGFLGDEIEVRFYFQDNGQEDNFYMARFDSEVLSYPDYDISDDEFFQGNEMFNFISNEDFKPGQHVGISLYGVSERFHNYMDILIAMADGDAGNGPFQTPPVSVRGNIINQSNEDNYALGYFRLSEVDTVDYIIQ